MSQEKHDESFRVVDRRLFTPEGELRKEAIEQENREAEARRTAASAPPQPPAAAAPPPPAEQVILPATPARPSSTLGGESLPQPASPESSRGFQMLVDLIAQNGAAVMGGMTDPRTGQPYVELSAAREFIDMLDALAAISRGNISADDKVLLQQVADSLKFTYAELSAATAGALHSKSQAGL